MECTVPDTTQCPAFYMFSAKVIRGSKILKVHAACRDNVNYNINKATVQHIGAFIQ